ncbi:MAG: VWA domain-containing protein [Hyphomicrobiales bacterium]|nr:VWA domain-containing protein [Hyphomicrobiales bacterium]
MPDLLALEQFHFLRPFWLAVIPVAIWLHLRLRVRYSAARQWKGTIAPHLLTALTLAGKDTKSLRPYQLMSAALIIASLALAGPAWKRTITPFTQDRAPLIIALKLTPSMLATDQLPTRLERAKQKIRDLLSQRKGARTALISYAGSAHAVLPLTDDAELVELYLASLIPSLMPKEGDDAGKALELAARMLADEEAPGTILFMNDGIDRTYITSFAEHHQASEDQILFLAYGNEAGGPIKQEDAGGMTFGLVDGDAPGFDIEGINAVANASGASVVRATPDLSDINRLSAQITSHLVNTIQQDEKLQWQDSGYLLVWPLAFLILLWSRRGWSVQWG